MITRPPRLAALAVAVRISRRSQLSGARKFHEAEPILAEALGSGRRGIWVEGFFRYRVLWGFRV